MIRQPPNPMEKPEKKRGLVCPKCACENFRVVYTRRALEGRIVRNRECRHCGRRIMTYERVVF